MKRIKGFSVTGHVPCLPSFSSAFCILIAATQVLTVESVASTSTSTTHHQSHPSQQERSLTPWEWRCRDNPNYVSKLFRMKCFQFETVSCEAFVHFRNFDANDVEELLKNCPKSCNACPDIERPAAAFGERDGGGAERIHGDAKWKTDMDLVGNGEPVNLVPIAEPVEATAELVEVIAESIEATAEPLEADPEAEIVAETKTDDEGESEGKVEIKDTANDIFASIDTVFHEILTGPSMDADPLDIEPEGVSMRADPNDFDSLDLAACHEGWDPLCQDDPRYESKYGLVCEQHSNVLCREFGNLGFTDAEVLELMMRCPCSCKVPCNTFTAEPTKFHAVTLQPTLSPTTSSPTTGPTDIPTNPPSVLHSDAPSFLPSTVPTSCTPCTDEATEWMTNTAKTCANWTWGMMHNCNENPAWISANTCQYSCFHAGRGYGSNCCEGVATPTPSFMPTSVPTGYPTNVPPDVPTFSPSSSPTTLADQLVPANIGGRNAYSNGEGINIAWSFEQEGQERNGGWWLKTDGTVLRFKVEDSDNCAVGGNSQVQSGTAKGALIVSEEMTLYYLLGGMAEMLDTGFETFTLSIDDKVVAGATSSPSNLPCISGPAEVTYVIETPPIILSPGRHVLSLSFTTFDNADHKDVFYELHLANTMDAAKSVTEAYPYMTAPAPPR